ncbi:MAG: S8 family serine peptidase [Candidatus Omnitrophota bacterium]
MRKIFLGLSLLLVIFLGLGGINIFAGIDEDSELIPAPQRKIVVFREGASIPERNAVLKQLGTKIKGMRHHNLVNATSVVIPENIEEVEAEILRNPNVKAIEPDIVFTALPLRNPHSERFIRPSGTKPTPQPSQVIPWGISRINAPQAWGTSTGTGVNVAILDTGIQLNHPDLQVNIKGGINTINPRKTPNDDNGHGTHVAGIIAGIGDNNEGIAGLNWQADLVIYKA